MRIVFFIPPPASPDHPLLGVASLATMAAEMGHEVVIFDLNAILFSEGFREKNYWQKELFDCWSDPKFVQNISVVLREKINSFAEQQVNAPDIIGFHVNDTSKEVARFCGYEFLRLYPDVKIAAGGPAFFDVSEEAILHEPYNVVICGEGEAAFAEWIKNNKKDDKTVIYGNKLESLDGLPIPDFSKFPMDLYARTNVFPIETSRGCINHCGFCNDVLMWGRRRKKSTERLFKELKTLQLKRGNIHISFCDSLLNATREEFKSLLRLLSGFDFTWDGMLQVEGIDAEIARMMSACGCKDVFLGIESFSKKFLNNINKAGRTADAAKVVQELAEAGIKPSIGLIIAGYPFQSRSDFEQDLETIGHLAGCLNSIAVNPLCIPKGTLLWKKRDKFGLKRLEGPKGWKLWQGPNGFADIETRHGWCLEAFGKLIKYGIQESANYTHVAHYVEMTMAEARDYEMIHAK